MRRAVAVFSMLVGTAACDTVFGLERDPVVIDAPRPSDAADAPVLSNHDEDGDGIDDAIDGCPNIFDTGQADADHDGIGDVCDPFPDKGGDSRAYFSSFRDFADWNAVSGTWMQTADSVSVTAGAGNQLAVLGRPAIANPTVIAVVEQPQPLAFSVDYGVMLVTQVTTDAFPPGVACYVDSAGNQVYVYDNRGQEGVAQKNDFTPSPPVTVFLEGVSGRTGPSMLPRCAARNPMGSAVESVEPIATVASAVPALYAYDGAATFKSVLVLTR